MQQNQLNLDITKTSPILTKEGGKVWQQGFILRKASRFLTGSNEDHLIPIQVFFDPKTGEICEDGLPQELLNLFKDIES
jgi:hypothetical protein